MNTCTPEVIYHITENSSPRFQVTFANDEYIKRSSPLFIPRSVVKKLQATIDYVRFNRSQPRDARVTLCVLSVTRVRIPKFEL